MILLISRSCSRVLEVGFVHIIENESVNLHFYILFFAESLDVKRRNSCQPKSSLFDIQYCLHILKAL